MKKENNSQNNETRIENIRKKISRLETQREILDNKIIILKLNLPKEED